MSDLGARRFALWSGAVALISGAGLLAVTSTLGTPGQRWGLLGWSITATAGVAGGAWAVARHGTAGSGFIVAIGACMLARLALALIGAVAAGVRGPTEVYAYLAGLAVGYVPVQILEMSWMARRSRART